MKIFFFFVISLLLYGNIHAQEMIRPKVREIVKPPAQKEKFHLYLLIGQSNMAGRGIVEPEDTIGNVRILRLNSTGDWEIAKDPVHFDKSAAGVGPGLSFAREILPNDEDIIIGLIPCAAGGSGIDIWQLDKFWEQTKSYPYNNALLRAKLAMKDGILKGILWHQGEADCSPEKTASYSGKLQNLIQTLRMEFQSPYLPFIAGEMPEFRNTGSSLNTVFHEAKKYIPNYAVVSDSGMTAMPDGVHLDARSARELGKRYATKMKILQKNDSYLRK